MSNLFERQGAAYKSDMKRSLAALLGIAQGSRSYHPAISSVSYLFLTREQQHENQKTIQQRASDSVNSHILRQSAKDRA